MSDLRREAEAWMRKLPRYWCDVEAVIAFAKAQRVKEVEAMRKYIAEEVNGEMDCTVQSMSVWLDKRAKELQP